MCEGRREETQQRDAVGMDRRDAERKRKMTELSRQRVKREGTDWDCVDGIRCSFTSETRKGENTVMWRILF